MPKSILTLVVGITAAVFLTGCSSSGVSARSYVKVKERVDQEMTGGNYGYFQGTPVAADRSNLAKTRNVYVMEFTKETPQEDGSSVIVLPPRKVYESTPEPESTVSPQSKSVVLPSLDDVDTAAGQHEPKFVDYKIEKDDTLQKISKKFYDSYSKWTRIYDANKEAIKDPNHIKPGMTLRIPVE